jgi:hypothetical protein
VRSRRVVGARHRDDKFYQRVFVLAFLRREESKALAMLAAL